MSEQDYFVYPDDVDSWNNEAWKQQIEDWAEQNREYHAEATRLRGLLRRATMSMDYCFICGRYLIAPMVKQDMKVGHADDCELVEELRDE